MADKPKRPSRRLSGIPWLSVAGVVAIVLAAVLIGVRTLPDHTPDQLLNVSYDPTREVYGALDTAFTEQYRQQTGIALDVKQSHGGSGRQARSVVDGSAKANVVSPALINVEALQERGLIAPDWQKRLPNNSVAYTSTIVFVVRKGNAKGISGRIHTGGIQFVIRRLKRVRDSDAVCIERLEHFLREQNDREVDGHRVAILLAGVRPAALKVLNNIVFQDWFPADQVFPEENEAASLYYVV